MSTTLISLSQDYVSLFNYVFNPGKRVYWLYLLSAVLLMCWLFKKNNQHALPLLWSANRRAYWFNKSSVMDIKWILLNHLVAIAIIIPLLGSQINWAMDVYRQLVTWFGEGDFLRWHNTAVVSLFTITLFLIDDFSRFLVHFAYHKIPYLWRFHAIHHSAKIMTPLTLYRVHLVEYILNSCRAICVIGTVSGVFIYCFDGAISVYEVFGISVLNFMFNLFGANLRHSHIWLGFGRFENIFISPAQHQIHHSNAKEHLDKNFGASLAIWDKLFRCWVPSLNTKVIQFGLYKQSVQQTLQKQWRGVAGLR